MMPLENTLAMTSVLELRMRRWLSGWSTHVLEAPTVPQPMHQNVRILNPPLDLLLRHVRVEIGNNWMSEGAVAGLTWNAEAAVSTYARYDKRSIVPYSRRNSMTWVIREGVKKNVFIWDFIPNIGPHPPTAHVWDSTK